jgi:hypothetical protein
LQSALEQIPDNSIPSANPLLQRIKELALENTILKSDSGKKYNFNINEKSNNLNIKLLLLIGRFKAGKKYDLDYYNQIIAHKKMGRQTDLQENGGLFS